MERRTLVILALVGLVALGALLVCLALYFGPSSDNAGVTASLQDIDTEIDTAPRIRVRGSRFSVRYPKGLDADPDPGTMLAAVLENLDRRLAEARA